MPEKCILVKETDKMLKVHKIYNGNVATRVSQLCKGHDGFLTREDALAAFREYTIYKVAYYSERIKKHNERMTEFLSKEEL